MLLPLYIRIGWCVFTAMLIPHVSQQMSLLRSMPLCYSSYGGYSKGYISEVAMGCYSVAVYMEIKAAKLAASTSAVELH